MNRFSSIKRFMCAALCALLLLASSYSHASAGFQPLSEQDYNALSPAERQAYEARFKTYVESMSPQEQEAFMQQEIEKIFNGLPPEQQKEVLEEAARIEKMSEEEQRAYFKQVEQELDTWMTQQQAAPAPAATTPAPAPVKEDTEAEPEPKKKEISAPQISSAEKAIKEAVSLLGEIAQVIDDITTKMESMKNLQFKLEQSWGKKKKISSWDGGFKWEKLNEKISLFRSQLDKLQDRDTTTKKHKYLPHLLENKALYNQLYNLSIDLTEQEPNIKGDAQNKKVLSRSNKAVRAVVNIFVASFFGKNNIIDSLNTIIAKFDPEAKKIAAKEEKATQRALAESRQPRYSSSVKVAGRSPEQGSYGRGYGDDYGSRGYGTPGRGAGYVPDSYGSQAAQTPKESALTDSTGAGSKGGTTGTDKAGTKEVSIKKDERIEKMLNRFDKKIDNLDELLSEIVQLSNLPAYVKQGTVNKNFAQRQIPDLMKFITSSASELVKLQENIKSLAAPVKASYAKAINITIDTVKKNLERLSADLSKVDISLANTEDMKRTHFGAPATKAAPAPAKTSGEKEEGVEESPETKKPADSDSEGTVTFADLKNKVDDFLKKVREFNTTIQ